MEKLNCPVCKTSIKRNNLEHHNLTKTHINKILKKCNQCNKDFKNLDKHISNMHASASRPNVDVTRCETCSKNLLTRNLQHHNESATHHKNNQIKLNKKIVAIPKYFFNTSQKQKNNRQPRTDVREDIRSSQPIRHNIFEVIETAFKCRLETIRYFNPQNKQTPEDYLESIKKLVLDKIRERLKNYLSINVFLT